MIYFEGVSKSYRLPEGRHVVLDNVTFEVPPYSRIGVLGPNGAGKSTLLRMIAGSEMPDTGSIIRDGRVSFPVGFTGTFHPLRTARENIAFLTHIYDMDYEEVVGWIEEFTELGAYFDMPVGTYSSGMFARMAFATSFALDFDVYLVDEAFEVGDPRFRSKCAAVFGERLQTAALVLVSQHVETIYAHCTSGILLHEGQVHQFATVDEAADAYETILRQRQ